MSTLHVYDMQGKKIADAEVSDDLLVLDKGTQAVHDVVVAHNAARRAGTASTLSKHEVSGSNKKPWMQKGTGNARAGYRQSPVWRGGAVVFGPKPRSYRKKINRKVSRLAFRRVLSEKLAKGNVKVLEEITLPEPKTKHFAGLMKALDVQAPALVVMEKVQPDVVKSARNIPGVEVVAASNVNVYQLLRYPAVIANAAGLEELKKRLMP